MVVETEKILSEEDEADQFAKEVWDEEDGKEKKEEPAEEEPKEEKPETEEEKPEKEPSSEDAEPSEEEEEEENPEETPEEKPEDEDQEQEKLKEYAVAHNLTLKEAEEEYKKDLSVIEKYGTNNIKMARAIREQQRGYDKLRSENESLKKDVEDVRQKNFSASGQFIIDRHVEENKETLITSYRNKYPNKSEGMTDEAIVEDLKDRALTEYKAQQEKRSTETSRKAGELREEILATIPQAENKYLPKIKEGLGMLQDQDLVAGDYNLQDIIFWAKGQGSDVREEEAYARGFKAGSEKAKILGEVPKSGGGDGKPAKKGEGSISLNLTQKKRAVQMFPDEPEAEAFKSFKEVYSEELKKNPNFIDN